MHEIFISSRWKLNINVWKWCGLYGTLIWLLIILLGEECEAEHTVKWQLDIHSAICLRHLRQVQGLDSSTAESTQPFYDIINRALWLDLTWTHLIFSDTWAFQRRLAIPSVLCESHHLYSSVLGIDNMR